MRHAAARTAVTQHHFNPVVQNVVERQHSAIVVTAMLSRVLLLQSHACFSLEGLIFRVSLVDSPSATFVPMERLGVSLRQHEYSFGAPPRMSLRQGETLLVGRLREPANFPFSPLKPR